MEEEQRNEAPADENPSDAETTDKLKSELADANARAESNLAGWQRAQADYINNKKRCEQEKDETVKYANSSLLQKIIPVLDDFDRAISSVPKEIEHVPWVKGIKLIHNSMVKTLEAQGLKPIECKGKNFDPNFHEALMNCEGEEGKVIQQIEKGYMFNNRLLRPARVMVGRGEGGEANNKEEK